MGIYKLSNKAEEIQETTMTDPLEKTVSWEWVEKTQNIFYQWLKMSIRNITNNPKFSVIKGVFFMYSWQTFVCINIFFRMKATISNPVLSEMSTRLQILGTFFK